MLAYGTVLELKKTLVGYGSIMVGVAMHYSAWR